MNDYKGKIIWIIGASSGIGRALALELDRRGARLILSARDAEALGKLAESLQTTPLVFPLDVTQAPSIQTAFEKIAAEVSPDSLIYMAGTYEPSKIENLNLDNVRNVIDVNLIGAIQAVRVVLPYFRKKRAGQITLCASVAGYRGLPSAQPYGATKAALINFAETLRCETARDNVDIKIINPGFVKTRLTDKNRFSMPMMITAEKAARIIADKLPTSRFEIAFPFLFVGLMKILRILPDIAYFKLMSSSQDKKIAQQF